jgi:hypothetical protein
MAPGDTTDPLRRSDPAVRVRGVATRAMHPDGAVHRDDLMRASTPGRLQGGPMLSPGGRNYYVEPIDESPPPNASGVPSLDVEDDAEDASVDTLRARNAELRGMLRDASDDLARARERETAVTGALRHFRERQEKLTDELSSAAATEEEVRAAHTRCAELEIEATEHKATAEAATRRAEHAESRLATMQIELDELRASSHASSSIPPSPSNVMVPRTSNTAADSVRDIIVAAAEQAATRKRSVTDWPAEESEELERRVHLRVESAVGEAQREWRDEMDAMDAERTAEIASLRDALARLRAEGVHLAIANEEPSPVDAKLSERNTALERDLAAAKATLAAATTELAAERDRAATLARSLDDARTEQTVSKLREPEPNAGSQFESLRDELEATKRLAAIQEREVVRATHAAAEQAARGGWTSEQASAAAAAAAQVPQALLERWRSEVFRLLLEQRRAPIEARNTERTYAKEAESLRDQLVAALGAADAATAAKDAAEARARGLDHALTAANVLTEKRSVELAEERRNARVLAESVASFSVSFDQKCDALANASTELDSLTRRARFAQSRVGLIAAMRDSSTSSSHGRQLYKTREATVSSTVTSTVPMIVAAPTHVPNARAADRVVQELELEITRLQGERAMLLRELKANTNRRELANSDARDRCARLEREATEARDAALAGAADNRRLLSRLERAEASAQRAEGEVDSLRSALAERDAEMVSFFFVSVWAIRLNGVFCSQAIIRDEFEKTKITLTESSRRKLEAAVASARAESDDAAKAAAHGLRREADGARREASRAAVAARQLERSLEKTKERMDEEHAKAVGVLEAKIGSLDRTVKELRRERNALLADARAHRARQRLEQRTNETSMGQSPSASMQNSVHSSPAKRVSFASRDENAAPPGRDTVYGQIVRKSPSSGGKVSAARSGRINAKSEVGAGTDDFDFEFPRSPGRSPAKPPAAARGRALGALLASAADAETSVGTVTHEELNQELNQELIRVTYDPAAYSSPTKAGIEVSLEDLEKSPSWQLRQRLLSLEARAARLLEEEDEELE